MFEASELLHSYVEGIRKLSGAQALSLFVPPPLSGLVRPLLLHTGKADPLPEIADLDAAEAFAERLSRGRPGSQDGRSLPSVVASSDAAGGLVPLPPVRAFWSGGLLPAANDAQGLARRRSDMDSADSEELPAAWLGFRFPPDSGPAAERLKNSDLAAAMNETANSAHWWEWLFSLGGALSSHTSYVSAILKDPVTGLPDRVGFQALLSEELEKARIAKKHLSLLLINPDEFAQINERFGREAGDKIIHEISERLRGVLRSSDPVARYGGAIFAAILVDTEKPRARQVSQKILEGLSEGAFLDGAVRLGFSIGIAILDPEDKEISESLQLIRRADQALNAAKRLGGSCIVDWEERSGSEETGAFDRLSGIFTGNLAKDYRNMVLLWDTIDGIAMHQDFDDLAGQVVKRIYSGLKPQRIGLFSRAEDASFELIRGLTRTPRSSGTQERVETVELEHDGEELMRLAIAAGEPREGVADDDAKTICYAMPFISSGEVLGALYFDGAADSLQLQASDLVFLKALAGQLAVALHRAQLAEREQARQEAERRQLRAELQELRQAIQQAKLVYRSAEFEAVVAMARRVAPTDATVLITGESGTGKELLAQTVHELSTRREQPFVIVDCGSIATTLIESELFGHEKGAYTGAQGRRVGRLAEAHLGTVLLDEIGELPLEVQSKLLRFVQEKQFTTVGGSRSRRVDVRILAATNRDLATEVAAGRFREDLYYRLNVVRLEVPPLRERPDDILHLARHFLETFSVQYQKNVRRFAPETEDALLAYPWPGNVRELQNRLMQAVILCEGENLEPKEIQLPDTATMPQTPSLPTSLGPADTSQDGAEASAAQPDVWQRLRTALGQEIELTLHVDSEFLFPLGKWLGDDLFLEADEAAQGIARRGAVLLSVPETTFRRRLRKAQQQARAGLAPRSGRWSETRSLLREIVRGEEAGSALVDRVQRLLLEEVLQRAPNDTTTGSSLLGVTAPTFRSRLADLRRAGAGAS
ncbi:MAG: sigma 54-interacting transcriptional regulator [Acidobacteriota bacterium]|nr:sigma 54-interacting transcriptional regulator [Acidobacteriota bacterium]